MPKIYFIKTYQEEMGLFLPEFKSELKPATIMSLGILEGVY